MGTEKQPVPSFSLAAPDRGKASTLEKTAYLVSLSMKKIRSLLLAFGSLGCFLSSLVFAEHPYGTAVLLEIQKKIATVPRSYLWDVVVTYSETETYELPIRMGNETYITDYTPIIQPSALPVEWKIGQPIEVRLEKRKMFLKTSYGEIMTYIVRRTKVRP